MIEHSDGSKKQTRNGWKYLSFVLMGVLAFGVTAATLPQAMAKPPEGSTGDQMMMLLTQIQDAIFGIEEDLDEGKYGQIVVATRNPQATVLFDTEIGHDTVTVISDGQEGSLHRTDCTIFGPDPSGVSTSNRVFLERDGQEVVFQLCDTIGTFELQPDDRIVYECEINQDHPTTSCNAEVTMWMTLRNT